MFHSSSVSFREFILSQIVAFQITIFRVSFSHDEFNLVNDVPKGLNEENCVSSLFAIFNCFLQVDVDKL